MKANCASAKEQEIQRIEKEREAGGIRRSSYLFKVQPMRDSFWFELYQGLHLINKLSEKELITKAE